MGEMKDMIEELLSFSDEEKKRLDGVSDELLDFFKEKKLTAKEALYVLNKCETVIYSSLADKLI